MQTRGTGYCVQKEEYAATAYGFETTRYRNQKTDLENVRVEKVQCAYDNLIAKCSVQFGAIACGWVSECDGYNADDRRGEDTEEVSD